MSLPSEVIDAVRRGWSVMPVDILPDGREKPAVKWKEYQSRRPTIAELEAWDAKLHPQAWGVVTAARR